MLQGTNRLIPLFDLSVQDGSDVANVGVKMNRLLLMKCFVDQQTDLKQQPKFTGNHK